MVSKYHIRFNQTGGKKMQKNTGTVIIALLAVLAIVFAILFLTGNGKIER